MYNLSEVISISFFVLYLRANPAYKTTFRFVLHPQCLMANSLGRLSGRGPGDRTSLSGKTYVTMSNPCRTRHHYIRLVRRRTSRQLISEYRRRAMVTIVKTMTSLLRQQHTFIYTKRRLTTLIITIRELPIYGSCRHLATGWTIHSIA